MSLEEDFARFAALPENWNSYGADRVSETAIAGARAIAARFSPALGQPAAHPTPSGGVTLEWEIDSRELQIMSTGDGDAFVFMCDDSTGQEWDGLLTAL